MQERDKIETTSKNTKRILITGASGFIGSFMVDEAIKRGYEVWAGVRKSSNKTHLTSSEVHFIDLDYINVEKLAQQVSEFDYIIHCAGLTKSVRITEFEQINHQHSVNLLDALRLSGAKLTKFIQMSSLSVMGRGDEINFTPFEPSDAPHPNTAYGKSKLQFDDYLEQNANVPYIILRPTGVYGPRERDYLMMIKSIKQGLNIKAGFTTQQLTFIYIQDLVDLAFAALESNIKRGTYLLSDGRTYSDTQYTQLIKKLLPQKHTINIRVPLFLLKTISHIAYFLSKITNRPATLNPDKYKIMKQRNWKCSIKEATDDFGFSPKYDLEAGLRATIEWYKKNNWI